MEKPDGGILQGVLETKCRMCNATLFQWDLTAPARSLLDIGEPNWLLQHLCLYTMFPRNLVLGWLVWNRAQWHGICLSIVLPMLLSPPGTNVQQDCPSASSLMSLCCWGSYILWWPEMSILLNWLESVHIMICLTWTNPDKLELWLLAMSDVVNFSSTVRCSVVSGN